MGHYLLRSVPESLHAAALDRSRRQGRSLRWVLLAALRDWVSGAWEPREDVAQLGSGDSGGGVTDPVSQRSNLAPRKYPKSLTKSVDSHPVTRG